MELKLCSTPLEHRNRPLNGLGFLPDCPPSNTTRVCRLSDVNNYIVGEGWGEVRGEDTRHSLFSCPFFLLYMVSKYLHLNPQHERLVCFH